MKRKYLITGLILVSLVFINFTNAQGRRGDGRRVGDGTCNTKETKCRLLGLSDEQQVSIDAERTAFMKDVQGERNLLNELQAKKQTLQSTDPVNKKELDKVLVEISRLKASIHKKKVRHQQAVKGFLSEEQLVQFDNRAYKRSGKGKMAMNESGRRNGRGKMGLNSDRWENANNMSKGYRHKGQVYNKENRADCTLMSDDQRKALKTEHLEMLKQQQPYKNKLNELRAELKTVCTGKNIDLDKADKLIEEQANTRLEMAKIRTNFKLQMRNNLTDEQKVLWDNRNSRGHKGYRERQNFN